MVDGLEWCSILFESDCMTVLSGVRFCLSQIAFMHRPVRVFARSICLASFA